MMVHDLQICSTKQEHLNQAVQESASPKQDNNLTVLVVEEEKKKVFQPVRFFRNIPYKRACTAFYSVFPLFTNSYRHAVVYKRQEPILSFTNQFFKTGPLVFPKSYEPSLLSV